MNNFLKDEFSKDVGSGTEYLYTVSEIIAKDFFDLPEAFQDTWGYSSVQDKNKYNVCFRPEKAHKMLNLECALICRKGENDEIKVKCIAKGDEVTNKVTFFPLGSAEQKKYFQILLFIDSDAKIRLNNI